MTDDRPAPPPGAERAPGSHSIGATGDQPPPFTAFAWRHGLVRPTRGRVFAGVSGALARATNTDPILWRVLFVVLAIFGGIGLLAYLLGWLLLPADADTASPAEALAGRGHSRTSAVATVIGIVLLVLALGSIVGEPFSDRGPFGTAMFVGTFLAVFVAGAILLLVFLLRDRGRVAAGPGWTPGQSGAGPAFAPRGPFGSPAMPATGSPYSPGTTPPPLAPPPVPPPPPRPPRQPGSGLGLLTLSLALVAIGALALVDLADGGVPTAGYVAAALAVVGLGLVIGGWFGRARGLIAVGILLTIALAIVGTADRRVSGGNVTWAPASVQQLEDRYHHGVGDATLDLRAIDFAAQPIQVEVDVDLGNLTIIIPRDVDVTVQADVDVGNADVFGESWGGLNTDDRTVTDLDSDGAGGGQLAVKASVNIGNLEVHR